MKFSSFDELAKYRAEQEKAAKAKQNTVLQAILLTKKDIPSTAPKDSEEKRKHKEELKAAKKQFKEAVHEGDKIVLKSSVDMATIHDVSFNDACVSIRSALENAVRGGATTIQMEIIGKQRRSKITDPRLLDYFDKTLVEMIAMAKPVPGLTSKFKTAQKAPIQLDLFDDGGGDIARSMELMKAIDYLTTKFGMDSVKLASQGFEKEKMNLSNFQPLKNQTTNIEDIITVK